MKVINVQYSIPAKSIVDDCIPYAISLLIDAADVLLSCARLAFHLLCIFKTLCTPPCTRSRITELTFSFNILIAVILLASNLSKC